MSLSMRSVQQKEELGFLRFSVLRRRQAGDVEQKIAVQPQSRVLGFRVYILEDQGKREEEGHKKSQNVTRGKTALVQIEIPKKTKMS